MSPNASRQTAQPPADYDIVVIGGGIHGVGVAQAAAAAGHSCLLLEERSLAAGTSSKSSKLIHGGLRYLETGQFSLVRECLRERAILLRLAPELVKLSKMYFPVYANSKRPAWQVRIGLMAYSLLGGLSRASRFRKVPRREWDQLDGLNTRDLRAVFQYFDAQTDDRLLTEAVMRSAMELGAELAMPATFEAATLLEHAVSIRFTSMGAQRETVARVVVNAAGPWANDVLRRFAPTVPPVEVELVAGTHIVLPVPAKGGVYYVESPRDSRVVFIMPWKGMTLVGTTETPFSGDPAAVAPRDAEMDYLLEVFNHSFAGDGPMTVADVQEQFAGLRVLPTGGGASVTRKSRETILHVDRKRSPRVLTIYGGKLTAYRATAEKVLKRLGRSLPEVKRRGNTREISLPVGSP